MPENQSIRCILVDDEPLALQILSDYVSKIPILQLEAVCSNALEALKVLKNQKIDLIFLDIQMPDLTGLEMLDVLQEQPLIIFTTAFPDYALDGFKYEAVDYLLKPISFAKFHKAVDKAATRLEPYPINSLTSSQGNAIPPSYSQHIFVKVEYKIVRLALSDILRIEGLKDYLKIYTVGGMILTLMNMKEIEQQLPPKQFCRIHKSHIVGISHIESIERGRVIIQGMPITIGATYKQHFLEIIGMN